MEILVFFRVTFHCISHVNIRGNMAIFFELAPIFKLIFIKKLHPLLK